MVVFLVWDCTNELGITNDSARIDMKVCWKYTPAMGESGPMPRHVAQARVALMARVGIVVVSSAKVLDAGSPTKLAN